MWTKDFTLGRLIALHKYLHSNLCTLPNGFLQTTKWNQHSLCCLGTSMANFSQFYPAYSYTHSAVIQQSLAPLKTVNTSCYLQNVGGSFYYLAMFS